VEVYGLDPDHIVAKAATTYLEDEAAYFNDAAHDLAKQKDRLAAVSL